ncbi:MAG: ABC transporter substrate-binding protein, partial [Candidatus Dormibacteria bacterium]
RPWEVCSMDVFGHRKRLLMALALPALALVACGGGSSSGGSGSGSPSPTVATATQDPAVANQVPAAIKAKGTLTAAADATYSPDEFIGPDGSTVMGFDVDLTKALGQVMGLQINVVSATFDTIIPGLTSGKYDLGVSSFTDTKAREQQVDFVTYFSSGEAFVVKASSSLNVKTLDDICGHTVGVESGTTEQMDAQTQDMTCKSAGKQGVTVSTYPDQNAVNLALSSGRVELNFLDSQIAAYQASISNGQFKVTGPAFNTAPYGIAIPKNNGMAPVVLAALKDLMTSGVYKQILSKWGVQLGAVSNPAVNGATS